MAQLPYTNFHDLNLNWFLKEFKKIVAAVSKKQDAPASPGVPGQVLGLGANQTPVWINQSGGGGDVSDVKINQSSIVDPSGVAVIPIAGANTLGVVMGGGNGVSVSAAGKIDTITATQQQISAGVDSYKPLTPAMENYAVFYGLARMAGYTQFSSLTYPVYTDAAIDKILSLLGIYNRILSPAGNTHTLLPCPFSYAFGEKAELNITVAATSEYHFSFSCPVGTPTVLTMTGATATAGDVVLEAGGYYEVNVWNGVALYRKVEVTGG